MTLWPTTATPCCAISYGLHRVSVDHETPILASDSTAAVCAV
jgi:hypothetical protein